MVLTNTKTFAEALARGAGVEAVSVDRADAALTEPVETLFIGGGLYAYGIDSHLKEYLQDIDGKYVGRAIVFSTSWISKHALDLIAKELKAKGIQVEEETLYAKSAQVKKRIPLLEAFGKKFA